MHIRRTYLGSLFIFIFSLLSTHVLGNARFVPDNHLDERIPVDTHQAWSIYRQGDGALIIRTPISASNTGDRLCDFVSTIIQTNGDSYGIEKRYHDKKWIKANERFWLENTYYPADAGKGYHYVKASLKVHASCLKPKGKVLDDVVFPHRPVFVIQAAMLMTIVETPVRRVCTTIQSVQI